MGIVLKALGWFVVALLVASVVIVVALYPSDGAVDTAMGAIAGIAITGVLQSLLTVALLFGLLLVMFLVPGWSLFRIVRALFSPSERPAPHQVVSRERGVASGAPWIAGGVTAFGAVLLAYAVLVAVQTSMLLVHAQSFGYRDNRQDLFSQLMSVAGTPAIIGLALLWVGRILRSQRKDGEP